MDHNTLYSLSTVLVIALMTLLTRLIPFLIFSGKKEPPDIVLYLGRVLPCAIMGMLVIYCLREISPAVFPYGLPELLAVAAAVGLHVWKRSTLLSIAVSTLLYMLLVQAVF